MLMRVQLKEGDRRAGSLTEISRKLGIDSDQLIMQLKSVDRDICAQLSLKSSLLIDGDAFAFQGVAGLLRVSPILEVEIVPKFMENCTDWRTEFLLLLARSRWGALLSKSQVTASMSPGKALNDSMALVFLSLFDKGRHIPIRSYRTRLIESFELEGELDEESLLLPTKEGFSQSVTSLSKQNVYNAVIAEAANLLSDGISNFSLKSRLEGVIRYLGPQKKPYGGYPPNVPARNQEWNEIYRLSIGLLKGQALDYSKTGSINGPGYVIRTVDAWEEFVLKLLSEGLPGRQVSFQEAFPYGTRSDLFLGKTGSVDVRPDYVIRVADDICLLADAKYKYSEGTFSVSNSDIYEGAAFMEATGCNRLALIYPSSEQGITASKFSTVSCPVGTIMAIYANPAAMFQSKTKSKLLADLASILFECADGK